MSVTFTVTAGTATYEPEQLSGGLRAKWQIERTGNLHSYSGTGQHRLHIWGKKWTLEQPAGLTGTTAAASFIILQNAYLNGTSGTWNDGTTSYDNVIILDFEMSTFGCGDEYKGKITFIRMVS